MHTDWDHKVSIDKKPCKKCGGKKKPKKGYGKKEDGYSSDSDDHEEYPDHPKPYPDPYKPKKYPDPYPEPYPDHEPSYPPKPKYPTYPPYKVDDHKGYSVRGANPGEIPEEVIIRDEADIFEPTAIAPATATVEEAVVEP